LYTCCFQTLPSGARSRKKRLIHSMTVTGFRCSLSRTVRKGGDCATGLQESPKCCRWVCTLMCLCLMPGRQGMRLKGFLLVVLIQVRPEKPKSENRRVNLAILLRVLLVNGTKSGSTCGHRHTPRK